ADRSILQTIGDEHRIGATIHLAASIVVSESVAHPTRYYRNNTAASLALMEQCLVRGVGPFIFSSTATVYKNPRGARLSETSPTGPISPYAASKLFTERMLMDQAAADPAFRPICLRYFNVAGADPEGRAGQSGPESTHLVRRAVELAVGKRDKLEIYGADYPTRDGTCERDYLHVSDFAWAQVVCLRHLMAGGEAAILNCGSGRGFTVREVIAALEALIGRKLPVEEGPRRAGDPARLVADARLIRRRTGWRPKLGSLEVILSTALAWEEKLPKMQRSRSE
ncbi:MAG: UDP-glucose 4-epimerase GalE, partial [Caulobacteraceae bacterium]